ncbi:MAG: tetratricopeptide repeat protein [Betaproteobacteria bacterium]|nr:tetratricopeptide repeat protein [Betaproteobacteria bacterium]
MMVLPRRLAAFAATLLAAGLLSSGVRAQQPSDEADDDDDDAPPAAQSEPAAGPPLQLPLQDLTGQTLYDFLLGEIAAQRGNPGLAAQTFLELAKRTRDPRVARRAVEIANLARMPALALESARIWHETELASAQALQAVTVLLVGTRRVDEAEPYIAKLLAIDANSAANGFMQLRRLLAGNPDPAANLRVVRKLAERYPDLPQSHLALSQAAAAASDETLALAEARSALALRPDWEIAALYEAQLLQRRSPGEAAKRLAAFLDKHPDSRDVRLGHARVLVLDKRYPEARAEFESILNRFPKDIDAIYAVGLLAFQVKEYAVAEANFKRLLELGYRDANAVRYTLGQIAEEQKDWPRAIGWYEAIQRGEQALPARMRIANAIAKQGKLAEARAYLRGVGAQGEPQRVQLLVAESQLLRDANLHREAFELLGEALQKSPDEPDLLYDHALTAEKLDHFDILESSLKRLIQLKPDHAHAYNALGYSFAERNLRLSEAKQLIEKALEIAPTDFFIIDSLGWVLYRMGDLKGAARELRRAWDGRPDGEIGAHLGEVLWTLGDRDEARRIWQESLKAGPENETLQKTLKRFGPP